MSSPGAVEGARAGYRAARTELQESVPPHAVAVGLAADAASYMVRDLIPADALAATVRHAFLDEIAEEPSYRVMSQRNNGKPTAPTICMALTGDRLPKLDMVLAIVTGCGGGGEDKQRFASAWRAIRTGASAHEPGKPEPGDLPQAAVLPATWSSTQRSTARQRP